MEQSFHQYWVHQGNTIVPNVLLRYYQTLQLTGQECLLIGWWLGQSREEYFPIEVEVICETFAMTENKLFQIIQHLIDRQCLAVTQREAEDGKKREYYSLTPLMQQLAILYRQSQAQQPTEDNQNIITIVEQEFGRQLSSFEIQTIASWKDQDHYSQELILAALKEAVLNQVFNLNYMDKILLTWQRKGFKTVQQVIMDKNRTRKGNFVANGSKDDKPTNPVPLYDWLH